MTARVAGVFAALTAAGLDFSCGVDPQRELSGPVDWSRFSGEGLAFCVHRDVEALARFKDAPGLVICSREVQASLPEGSYLFTSLPRAAFIMASWVFVPPRPAGVHPTAVVDPRAEIGAGASIGPLSVVGAARIGPRAVIGTQASISDHVVAGEDLVVQDGAHIGVDGLGSMADGHGHMRLFPHFERLLVGDRVVFGAGVIVQRGVLTPTVIGDDTHFSMGCFVGHNARVGSGVFCAPGSSIAGSAVVGDGCCLWQGACVRDGLVLPERTTVGMNVALTRAPREPGQTLVGAAPASVGNLFGWERS